MSSRKPAPTRDLLHRAAVRMVSRHGPGASVRLIAAEAGLTEGALYRHYDSREHLLGAVFAELVEPMVAEKEMLSAMRAPLEDRLREWVRCTYSRFDSDPEGFSYVFLTDHELPKQYAGIAGRQSSILARVLREGLERGELRDIPADVASAMFVGLLLCVPSRIRSGNLKRPASAYVDEVARAIWLALSPS